MDSGASSAPIGAVTAGAVTAVVGVGPAGASGPSLRSRSRSPWPRRCSVGLHRLVPRFCFSRTSLREMAGFSANVFGTRLLFYADRNVDNLLIGRFIGAAALGLYAVAYNLMLVPLERIAGPLQQVFYPAIARLQASPSAAPRLDPCDAG